jgi:probable F420-dependent oxidoreductase
VRAFRFGVLCTQEYSAAGLAEFARGLEGDGFDTLLAGDHFVLPMSCGPMLAAAAAATSTLRVGSHVYSNDFRHPALLAKEAATIDVLSGGRMELGLGAGWLKLEYDLVGIPFDAPGPRVERLAESVGILTQLFGGDPVHHAGRHYRLGGAQASPSPLQRPLPLLIGCGAPRLIRLAAAKAQIISLQPRALPEGGLDDDDFGPAAMDAKIEVLDEAIAHSGRDDGGPERGALLFGVFDSPGAVPADEWTTPEFAAASPHAVVGGPQAIAETLLDRRERWGLSYVVCFDQHVDALRPAVSILKR